MEKLERFDFQVLLSDGSFEDFEVQTERHSDIFEVLKNDRVIATFKATKDGGWELEDNPGNVDKDLEHRITLQLNSYRISK